MAEQSRLFLSKTMPMSAHLILLDNFTTFYDGFSRASLTTSVCPASMHPRSGTLSYTCLHRITPVAPARDSSRMRPGRRATQ